MKKKMIFLFIAVFACVLTGCAQQSKSENSQQAIEQAKTLQTVEEQAKYLVSEANAFINSKKFEEAVATAKYILAELDGNSQEAKSILERAQEELKKLAEQKAAELKIGADQAIDDMKDKVSSFGK